MMWVTATRCITGKKTHKSKMHCFELSELLSSPSFPLVLNLYVLQGCLHGFHGAMGVWEILSAASEAAGVKALVVSC